MHSSGGTRTTGGGAEWHATTTQNANDAGTGHPHRTRDANDGWRWWLAKHTPIDRQMQTKGGGGGSYSTPPSIARCKRKVELVAGKAHPIDWQTRMKGGAGGWHSTPPSNARRERRVGLVAGKAHPHQSRDANEGGSGGWQSTPPSISRCQRKVEVVARTAHPHRTRDANDGWGWWLAKHMPIERETRTMGGGGDWRSTTPSNARRER